MYQVHGTAAFSLAAFVGRLPVPMLGLGIIILISTLTGSYTAAGTVAAMAMVGYAAGAPIAGRLVDQYGQHRILLVLSILHGLSLAALMVAADSGASVAMLCAVSLITGASRPSTGTMVRTRWAYVLERDDPGAKKERLQRAFSLEAILDEVTFISGPIIVTALATSVHYLAGLSACLVMTTGGAVALALQRGTAPPANRVRGGGGSALAVPGMLVIAVVMMFAGAIIGVIDLSLVARAEEVGTTALAGPLLTALAVGSIIGGLWYGNRSWRLPPHTLWIRALAAQALGLGALALAGGVWTLAAATFVAGLAVAPAAISGAVLLERLLPPRLLTEAFSIETTSMAIGVALGGWGAGMVTDFLSPTHALLIPSVCALVACFVAMCCSRWLRAEERVEAVSDSR
ncbi:hypothetical protein A6A08_02415 [Nocardiopsis sp. TSRI0078]|nr:hypothetical protein A6A08_02415 [Nocardiopsis sp. TSRI0078]